MNEIRDSVLNSVQLELSPSARQSLAQAKTQWSGAQASRHREPEPWVYPVWRSGDTYKGEPDIVILKPGSQPPELVP